MPPPSSITPSDTVNITKNPVKENLSPPEFKDPQPPAVTMKATSPPTSTSTMTQVTTKNIQEKFIKTQRQYNVSDGLETGSDSDGMEGNDSMYSTRKTLSNTNKLYDSPRLYGSIDQMSKVKDKTLVKPISSSIQTAKKDMSGRDNTSQRGLPTDCETPYLSEFMRRLREETTRTQQLSPRRKCIS